MVGWHRPRLVSDMIDLPVGVEEEEVPFDVISTNRSCESNLQGIKPFRGIKNFGSLQKCQKLCVDDSRCNAIDYYRVTTWCNLYYKACETPLLGNPEISLSNARHMRRALSRFTWDGNISAEPPARGSVRRRVSSVKSYTIPAHPRPGKRCALAKRDLGDDLLAVVAVVPVDPWDFDRRETMRKYLMPSAHKLRSRRYYRKIVTSTTRKRAWLSKADQNFVNKLFSDSRHQSKKHNWGWFKKYVGKPVEDNRAVCVDVIFMVSRQPIWLQHHC